MLRRRIFSPLRRPAWWRARRVRLRRPWWRRPAPCCWRWRRANRNYFQQHGPAVGAV